MKRFINIMKFIEKHMLTVLILALFLIVDYMVVGLCMDINPGPAGIPYLYTLFVALAPVALWVVAGFAWMIIYNFLPDSVTEMADSK